MHWSSVNYAVVDVESDGRPAPDPVEVAVVLIEAGQISHRRQWLVRPLRGIEPNVSRIHGIYDVHVAGSPTFEEIREEVRAALGARLFVAHNAHVDWNILRPQLPDWRPPSAIDTLRLARALLPGLGAYGLSALVKSLGLDVQATISHGPHRAAYDADAAAKLFLYLMERTHEGSIPLARVVKLGSHPSISTEAPDQLKLF